MAHVHSALGAHKDTRDAPTKLNAVPVPPRITGGTTPSLLHAVLLRGDRVAQDADTLYLYLHGVAGL